MSDPSTIDEPSADDLFRLAEDYLRAARAVSLAKPGLPRPATLLSLHASELFLKAYLRSSGIGFASMRKFGHDLSAHADCATEQGLDLGKALCNNLRAVTDIRHYVAARYQPRREGPFSSTKGAIGLASSVREVVRLALAGRVTPTAAPPLPDRRSPAPGPL